MTRAVHERNGKVVMQIVHGGAASLHAANSGNDYLAVSQMDRMPEYGQQAREMTLKDIERVIQAFGQAARRVQEAGFDGVQIHGAHGYLISQFLKKDPSPEIPDDRPGLTIEEGARVAQILEQEGVVFIEISNGFLGTSSYKIHVGIRSPEKEAYFLPEARIIRKATTVPLCLAGGMRSLPVMEEILRSGIADCISISRPLIREPDLIKRWLEGDARPAECISCGGCFNTDEQGRMRIFCRQLKKAAEKA
ncbi:MAG: hypothetical protein HY787_18170 [Deltaproteobacteria bacterium]|nr:hypothetical protein [Deltaproteobacteria bacterium]